MRVVLQRVTRAEVRVEGRVTGAIDGGFVALIGVAQGDREADAGWVVRKMAGLRVFGDAQGKMNQALGAEPGRSVLAISQFTLLADTARGLRPSFSAAAPPEQARRLYELVIAGLGAAGIPVATGVFGAHMQVELVNDGPVTLVLDSRRGD